MAVSMRVWPGRPYPLGATWDGRGVNFALFSANAEKVELCLFDPAGTREVERIVLPEYTDEVWHVYLPEARPGMLYGYRVFGPYEPRKGHRFNHHKLLLDPYAKALHGTLRWTDAHFAYRVGSPRDDLSFDRRDNARGMPKCRVVDTAYTWGEARRPCRSWHETIIYELHLRGFTMLHHDVPQPWRGTFAGMSSPHVIEYLQDLGVTAVELLPVHAFIDDRHLIEEGLRNYWGYNSIAFFAPEPRYMSSHDIGEFKTMVQRLHEVGIEVILDVVYNHTAEGNEMGPTLSFRGIDNASYYRLVAGDERHYVDFTGCGNALNLHHPRVLQLVMDSLRYWVEEMGVDGFRFDLATTLAREQTDFDRHSGFLDAVRQDPVLARVKLIAESWDIGNGGYQVGNFPPGWSEWNDKYRDTVRRFWKGEDGGIGELASRITGSSDLFRHDGRRPWATINYVTAHDGFTLADLVSYNDKHNEANREDNNDGTDANFSWNCGAEGPTNDPEILALRRRQQRNFFSTLLLSQGVPMLLAGDEIGNGQDGNNNAYCQDNRMGWIDWPDREHEDIELLRFVRGLIRLRQAHPVWHRRRFFRGELIPGGRFKDITWLAPSGREMTEKDWHEPHLYSLAFFLSGESGERYVDPAGKGEPDNPFLAFMNAHHEPVGYTLPREYGERWTVVVDTAEEANPPRRIEGGSQITVPARSFVVLMGD